MMLPGVMLDGMMLSSGAEAILSPLMFDDAPPPGTVGAKGSEAAESRWDIIEPLLETGPELPLLRAAGARHPGDFVGRSRWVRENPSWRQIDGTSAGPR